MTAEQRSARAKAAAEARWTKHQPPEQRWNKRAEKLLGEKPPTLTDEAAAQIRALLGGEAQA
jgi:hypothetical protein